MKVYSPIKERKALSQEQIEEMYKNLHSRPKKQGGGAIKIPLDIPGEFTTVDREDWEHPDIHNFLWSYDLLNGQVYRNKDNDDHPSASKKIFLCLEILRLAGELPEGAEISRLDKKEILL